MAKLLEPHEMIDFNSLRLADTVDVVARKIHKHDVFRPVLLRIQELLSEHFVLYKDVSYGIEPQIPTDLLW